MSCTRAFFIVMPIPDVIFWIIFKKKTIDHQLIVDNFLVTCSSSFFLARWTSQKNEARESWNHINNYVLGQWPMIKLDRTLRENERKRKMEMRWDRCRQICYDYDNITVNGVCSGVLVSHWHLMNNKLYCHQLMTIKLSKMKWMPHQTNECHFDGDRTAWCPSRAIINFAVSSPENRNQEKQQTNKK